MIKHQFHRVFFIQRYWVNTLSSTPTLSNKEYVAGIHHYYHQKYIYFLKIVNCSSFFFFEGQIQDLAEKLDAAESSVDKRGFRSNTDDGPGNKSNILFEFSKFCKFLVFFSTKQRSIE